MKSSDWRTIKEPTTASNDDRAFGAAFDAERKPRVALMVPCEALNHIEYELNCAVMHAIAIEEHRAPLIFIDEDGKWNSDAYEKIYGRSFTLNEATILQNIIFGRIAESYRRQLIVAREAGEHGTMADYLFACKAEGIEPRITR